MAYTVTSTKSYMQAMEPMEEMLQSFGINGQIEGKIANLNAETNKLNPIEDILSRFQGVDSRLIRTVHTRASSSVVLREIENRCQQISRQRDGDKDEVLDSIKSIIESTNTDEELQSSLFDILGFEEIDLISKIVQNKQVLQFSSDVSVANSNSATLDGHPHLLTAEERAQLIIDTAKRTKNQKLAPRAANQLYPHVYKNQDFNNAAVVGGKFALPVGSTRESYGTYEEVVIPYVESKRNKWIGDNELVHVSGLDFLCQKTFHNYKTLNRMQSLVYPVAYNTNENMLVCAPTGAGKTDVALLTILHTINQFVTETGQGDEINVDIDYDEFKIIYVAPLKALAAEIVDKFSSKLRWLGITVKELTGDMQLTRQEIFSTQVIVTTPEKWDVVTRKSGGDNELVSKVKLLIIDEVHLLHEDRGSVIETLVARTLRQVESTQSMIRVVGLSATLPNYMDVADFLGVNRQIGMFYFDQSFRPCPLKQELIGVRGKAGSKVARENIDKVSYNKLIEHVAQGLQVMVFVHSRKDTVKAARTFIQMAQANGESSFFDTSQECESYEKFSREMAAKNRNKDMKELFAGGFGVHHAGMLRTDRNLTEKLFLNGAIKVLCCTATLAWGVNLPAAVVIVKGTQVYDSKQGGFVDLGISDVIQIFGRAGRPQYGEEFGTGILCTTSDRLDHYVSLITQQHPIESRFSDKLVDNLNAEISLGTVTTVDEAIQWMGYTYMMVRMRQNPFAYGIDRKELELDPTLMNKRHDMVVSAARRLHSLQMIVFDEQSGAFTAKDLGRIASDFYLLNNSVEVFNQMVNPRATEADILAMISMSSEFDSVKFREEESTELKHLLEDAAPCQVAGTGKKLDKNEKADNDSINSSPVKTNILLQAYISKALIKDSALISDCNYVAQNSARICRALFLIGINRRWGQFSRVMLSLCKSIDKRIWGGFDHPMAQFDKIPDHVMRNLRSKSPSMEMLRDMNAGEMGDLVHNHKQGSVLNKLVDRFPYIEVDAEVFPVTSNVMRVHLDLQADFIWDERYHGNAQTFWIMVEGSSETDSNLTSQLLHVERLMMNRRSVNSDTPQAMDFMIPLSDPLPAQIVVRVVSDYWIGSDSMHTISFQHLIRPSNETVRTNLLRLQPLPIKALQKAEIEKVYSSRFSYFNPMQTMAFHSLYNTNSSVFVGSPTGSGKTVVAELAMWHAFNEFPGSKVVYIAPMKALVRERVDDWRQRLCGKNSPTGLKLVELTGDSLPEARDVRAADIIVTTPEKFDGISRNWQTRKFVQQVSLVIMDEIHLLASDRGPILEMIVSRMNYISGQRQKEKEKSGLKDIRLLGMSTAVSNAIDMAGWLKVKEGLFNFPSSVRPVPLQMYIDGFPDNLAFCPLMKTMNKPAFMAIKQHSPTKPVLIFVASRRQTRLTALDLIHLCGMEANPRRFLKINDDEELRDILDKVKDETLKLSLQFGMGLHHAGLVESDRQISHKLFESGKIQILIATSTLAWGVNLPAHLVIIKGTQFFDSKIEGYRDMDLTDILQMMGRAGRPAFDTSGTAIVYTRESKKVFYKHFLNVGFPVESSLHKVLDNHLGAEIAAGTVKTRQEAMDFLTWTFLYRRAHNNPTYYGIEDTSTFGISKYLGGLIDTTIENLVESKCVITAGENKLIATPFLHISSYYYLSHKTMRNLIGKLTQESTFRQCLRYLCEATEYDELATRHGEELINMEMSQAMRYPLEDLECEHVWDPHVKAFLLLEAYMSRVELPIVDYVQDTVAVLDHSLRVLQAYVDATAELGYLEAVLTFITMMRCIKQRCWFDDDPISCLPGVRLRPRVDESEGVKVTTLKDLGGMNNKQLHGVANKLGVSRDSNTRFEFIKVASSLPTGKFSVEQDSNRLVVELAHDNEPLNKEFRVHCPHFPKAQRESWFVIVSKGTELLLLKRASPKLFGKKGKVSCVLEIPDELRGGGEYKVSCVNDAQELQYEQRIQLN
uniref:RQC trigger complex helicase Slh1p n=1 Tax=[Candida] anglica TaxID=148631 RepID=A0ABP0ELL8_9ASCO